MPALMLAREVSEEIRRLLYEHCFIRDFPRKIARRLLFLLKLPILLLRFMWFENDDYACCFKDTALKIYLLWRQNVVILNAAF